MKNLRIFESFEVAESIKYGEPLNDKEIKFLQGYNIIYPEWVLKDDNYYYVHDHRCENIKDLPATYIHGVCKEYNIKNYTINDDHTIDVDDNVSFIIKGLSKIPLIFNIVSGSFNCSFNYLTTLEGGPKYVGGHYGCAGNKLYTLEGSPKSVEGNFICSNNKLTTLIGGPAYVGRNFDCEENPLTSVEYKGIIKGKLKN